MDRLQAMEVFTRVVETNSFSKAAELLDLPRGSVSNLIQALEQHVGVRLLNRTTRQVSVTEDGALYYERCVGILAEISDAESSLSNKRQSPAGTIRVDTSGTLAKALLLPALGDFYEHYPEIEVRLGLADRNIDLIQDGVDCVIRMGFLEESSLVARRIGNSRITTCASPAYLAEHGTPTTLKELEGHCAVNYVSARSGKVFPFEYEVNGEVVKDAGGCARGQRWHGLHYRGRAGIRHHPAFAFHGSGHDRAGRVAGNTHGVHDPGHAAVDSLSASAHEFARARIHRMDHRTR
jgi:LysR family transcriptional regulator for bpeEF and oprC